MECIKAGKKVTENNGWTYSWKEGYIYCKYCDGAWVYNAAVGDENLRGMEVEEHKEEKPLKIETGRFYCTRDGRRAYCFFKEEDGFYNFVIDGQIGCGTYAEDGLVLSEEENPDDIVDYWEE